VLALRHFVGGRAVHRNRRICSCLACLAIFRYKDRVVCGRSCRI